MADGPPPPPPPPSQPGWSPPPAPPPASPGVRPYGYQRGPGPATAGIYWQYLFPAFIPTVFAVLPLAGFGFFSSIIGIVIFATRTRYPVLRKTAFLGIGLCLVALVIAIVKTSLLQSSIY